MTMLLMWAKFGPICAMPLEHDIDNMDRINDVNDEHNKKDDISFMMTNPITDQILLDFTDISLFPSIMDSTETIELISN